MPGTGSSIRGPHLALVRFAPFSDGNDQLSAEGLRKQYNLRDWAEEPEMAGALPPPLDSPRGLQQRIKTPRPSSKALSMNARGAMLKPGSAHAEDYVSRPAAQKSQATQLNRLILDRSRSGMKDGPLIGLTAFSNSVHSVITPRIGVVSPRRPLPSQMPRALADALSRRHEHRAERPRKPENAAVEALSSAAAALEDRGILVNSISPEWKNSPRNQNREPTLDKPPTAAAPPRSSRSSSRPDRSSRHSRVTMTKDSTGRAND